MQLTAFSSKSRNVTKRSTAITSRVLNYTSEREHSDLEQRSAFCFNAFLYKCNKSNFNKIGRCHQIKQISIDKNILFFKTKRAH